LNRNLELAGNLDKKLKRKVVARELEWELSNELHLALVEQAQICQEIPIGEY
jgi:hypothetical protein